MVLSIVSPVAAIITGQGAIYKLLAWYDTQSMDGRKRPELVAAAIVWPTLYFSP